MEDNSGKFNFNYWAMNENQTIPVVFCVDHRMVMQLGVTITSLVLNADGAIYDIYVVVDETVNEDDKSQLNGMRGAFQIPFSITFIDVSNKFDFKNISLTYSYWSKANYYRLLIPNLLPQYETVIYSDADIIFQSSLKDIYMHLGENYLAASQDNVNDISIQKRMEKLGLSAEQYYFCAGFLVMNLKKFRDEGLVDKSIELMKEGFEFMDQDILNVLCKGRVVYLSPYICRYSLCANPVTPIEKETLLNGEDVLISLRKAAIHYTGKIKPWNGLCHRWEVWWHYYILSPFFDCNYYWQRQHDIANGDYLSLWRRIKLLVRYFVGKDSVIQKVVSKI